jgi:hypothetical protein
VPTFERGPRFDREFRRLSRELQRAFQTLPPFITALRARPPAFPPKGAREAWEGSTEELGVFPQFSERPVG